MQLILYNIRSRFNVGAIFRTADAGGIDKIYLCGITPQPPHPKIDKVALDAEKTVSFEFHKQTVRLIKNLKKQKYTILALEQSKDSIPYFKFKSKKNKKTVLILGSEVKGLPKKILDLVDWILEIPMHGKKESLNVGIATGIVIFELIK
ncbi:MAG: TrmH family RNA methyltransferase [Patescibacteria group bacterium]